MFRFLTRAVLLRVLGRRFVPFIVAFEVLRTLDRLRRGPARLDRRRTKNVTPREVR
jgi:hypothetical protein